ncbi:chloramphenicol acetyltransferase (plasmid) [Rhodobacteraceae bacterium SC52]|nr:chloramphenicol acetyltransferase [Rhodobacteraceae bacterium SC52]
MARLTEGAPYVHPDCEITDTEFGRFVEIGRGSRVAHSTIGDYSYCDRYSDIANAEILKFSNIASFTRIGATDHPMDKASLHHFHYRSNDYWDNAAPDEAWLAHRRTRRAVIGHDTWIGHGAMIKPEVTLGHGSVVASGAIVTRDVDPYTVVAGLPAKPVRARYAPGIADRMIALAWWDWPHDRLRATLEDFRALSAEEFLERYE